MTTRRGRAERDPARLGRRLRALRERAGYGGVEAARRAGMSQSKISRFETCRLIPRADDIRVLCNIYGADPAEAEELIELAERVRADSKRSQIVLARGAARLQQRIQQMEAKATLLRSFQPSAVIGMLQTEAYIRAIFGDELAAADLDAVVAARLNRQAALADPSKQFVFIMSEGALRWQLGSAALMAEQIDALVEATRQPALRLGIIPWTRPVNVVTNAGFHLYDSAAVVIGTEAASATFTEPDDVGVYEDLFTQLEAVASFGGDARRELARIGSEYRLLK